MITQAELKELLDYNPDTGLFTYKNNKPAPRGLCKGYLRLTINKNIYYQHRLAWLYMLGSFPINEIDHINGIRHDNRISNLRDATYRENVQNRKYHREGKLVGCYFNKKSNKWFSCVTIKNRTYYIGKFDSEKQASEAYFKVLKNLELFLQLKPKSKQITNIYFDKMKKLFIVRKTINKVKYSGYFKTEDEALDAVKKFSEAV